MQRPPSQRQLRVGEQLKQIIAETLQRGDFANPVLVDAPHVTVTEVRASPDLRNATAYVVAHNDDDLKSLLDALNMESRLFQKEINRQSSMKFTPRISFKHDKAFEKANRIESLLHSISYSDQEIDE